MLINKDKGNKHNSQLLVSSLSQLQYLKFGVFKKSRAISLVLLFIILPLSLKVLLSFPCTIILLNPLVLLILLAVCFMPGFYILSLHWLRLRTPFLPETFRLSSSFLGCIPYLLKHCKKSSLHSQPSLFLLTFIRFLP